MPSAPQSPNNLTRAAEELQAELLVLHARSGSREAFEQLVGLWQERLWSHAFRMTGSQEVAWDVMQESWIGVTRGIKNLREPRYFGRWAFQIVTRAAIAQHRRKPREQPTAAKSLDEYPHPDDTDHERKEALSALRSALDQLDEQDRALVCLRYLEGFELIDLAATLNIPEGTVKSRLHRIRKQLRSTLERMLS